MARELNRGGIWLLDLPRPDKRGRTKRRPVLILSRGSLIEALHTVTVAAVTSTLRGSPTEVELGPQEGLKYTSCANLCNVFTVPKARLRSFVGSVGRQKMLEVCRALAAATDCE